MEEKAKCFVCVMLKNVRDILPLEDTVGYAISGTRENIAFKDLGLISLPEECTSPLEWVDAPKGFYLYFHPECIKEVLANPKKFNDDIQGYALTIAQRIDAVDMKKKSRMANIQLILPQFEKHYKDAKIAYKKEIYKGKEIWRNSDLNLRDKYEEYLLCNTCQSYEDKDGIAGKKCPVHAALGSICIEHDVAIIITECSKFIKKIKLEGENECNKGI